MTCVKEEWPEYMIIPSPEEFSHGSWIDPIKGLGGKGVRSASVCGTLNKLPQYDDIRYECRTRCCLVGFAALAFGEPGCDPDNINNMATVKFLNKIIELHTGSGFDITDIRAPTRQHRVLGAASDVFECGEDGPMEPEEAHEHWVEAARYFGYDI